MKKIVVILASEQKNLELANRICEVIKGTNHESVLLKLVELDLPLYSSRMEAKHSPVEILGSSLGTIQSADGFVFLSPEYNGGIPPILTNFIAWVSRSTKNWRESFTGKPVALGTYSGGPGSNVITALRLQLSYIGMNVVGRAMQFHSKNDFKDEDIQAVIGQLVRIIPA